MVRPGTQVRKVPRTDMRHHSGVNCCRCLIRPSNSAAQLPDDFFHRQTDRQDLAVGVLRSGDHHADWCGARYMAGNRQGAAVEQVDDCRVAQHAQVEAGISFVVLTCFGDRRRGLWGRRHQHRVIAGGGGVDRSDELLAQFNQFDVACGRAPRKILVQKEDDACRCKSAKLVYLRRYARLSRNDWVPSISIGTLLDIRAMNTR